MPDGWQLIARLALALWFVATMGLLVEQVRERLAPPWPHPETPHRNPREGVVEGCRTLVGQEATLGIVYSDATSWADVFIAYRLAYLMYPQVVSVEPYAGSAGDDEAAALSRTRQQHPSHIVVLGASDPIAPDLTLVGRLGPEARVYRAEPERP